MLLRTLRKTYHWIRGKRSPYISSHANKTHAYRLYDGDLFDVEIIDASANVTLSNNIIQAPGFVEVDGHVYDLTKDGVYRFYRLPEICEQRLVCNDGRLTSLLKMLGYLWRYGNRDDGRIASSAALLSEPCQRSLSIGCGYQAKLALRILCSLGHECRLVACMSKSDWGGQDDGHTLLEVKEDNGKWSVYDPSFRLFFKDISILDLCSGNKFVPQSMLLVGHDGASDFSAPNYDYGFWVEQRFLNKNSLESWYGRVMQVPLIKHKNEYLLSESYLDSSCRNKFQDTYRVVSDTEFKNLFYKNVEESK